MNYYQVISECYADTVLVEMLGFEKPNHQLGIGKVINDLKMKNWPAVGIIDDDKQKPKELDHFQVKDEKNGIKWLTKDKHHVLVICPAFEAWVFKNAEEVNVDPEKYGFANSKVFQKASKSQQVNKDPKVKQFLNTLNQKGAPGFVQLRQWICEGAGISPLDC
jgi:hypothetical protein